MLELIAKHNKVTDYEPPSFEITLTRADDGRGGAHRDNSLLATSMGRAVMADTLSRDEDDKGAHTGDVSRATGAGPPSPNAAGAPVDRLTASE